MENFFSKIRPVLYILVIIWVIFLVDLILPIEMSQFGIVPRNIVGLRGILFSPLLHANFSHLISNSGPFLILCSMLFLFYEKDGFKILVFSGLLSGALVWIFARPAIHIGLSGVIYALASFLIFAGFFRKKFVGLIVSAVVLFFYGGLVWGILPQSFYVSWEGHLSGAVVGYFLARSNYTKP